MNLQFLTLTALILTACAPQTTKAVAEPAAVRESAKSHAAVGSYILYLQAKQDLDFPAAVNYLKAALKEDADNQTLKTEMFTLLAVEGRLEEAYPYAVEELKKDKSSLLAALTIIARDARKGDYAGALKQIKAFPDKKDNAFLFPLLELWVQAGAGNRKKAEQALAKLNTAGAGRPGFCCTTCGVIRKKPAKVTKRCLKNRGDCLCARRRRTETFCCAMGITANFKRWFPPIAKRRMRIR